jgi:hypothetical protein
VRTPCCLVLTPRCCGPTTIKCVRESGGGAASLSASLRLPRFAHLQSHLLRHHRHGDRQLPELYSPQGIEPGSCRTPTRDTPPIGSTHTSTNQYCGLLRTNRCEESDGRLLRPSASRRAACHWTRGEFLELVLLGVPLHASPHGISANGILHLCAYDILSDDTRSFLIAWHAHALLSHCHHEVVCVGWSRLSVSSLRCASWHPRFRYTSPLRLRHPA